MAMYGIDEWAIILGMDNKIDIIKLTNVPEYEWHRYETLKTESDKEIVWFDVESEAVDFVLDNFDKDVIHPDVFTISKSKTIEVPDGFLF